MQNGYRVITICGSTKFKDEILAAQRALTLQGNVVLSCPFFQHAEGLEMSQEEYELLAKLHNTKIDMSDAIYVVNVNNYIGESVRDEIDYAMSKGKEIIYMK